MAWYRNTYQCDECGTGWDDEWSCCCDDECPSCGASDFSPVESEDLSVYVDRTDDGDYEIYYSPAEAGHEPDYQLLATTYSKNLSVFLRELALELSKPA